MTDPTVDSEVEPLIDADLLEEILCALVRYPSAVRVEEVVEGPKTTFKIHAHPDDVGLIIGRRGATVKVLRQLFSIIANKEGRAWPYIDIVSDRAKEAAAE